MYDSGLTSVQLAYGLRPLSIEVGNGSVIAAPPTTTAHSGSIQVLLEQALEAPIGAPPWNECAAVAKRVLVIVSDETRFEPRREFLRTIRSGLRADAVVTVAIANGTHQPREPALLGLPSWVDRIVNHDSRTTRDLVSLGLSSRGTPLMVNRAVLEADLIVATGSIRPHYFAGFGGGVKALFPGLGENKAIRANHQLKAEPRARAGEVVGNPCREDLESILPFLSAPIFLINSVVDVDDQVQAIVCGDVVAAHRVGCELSRPLHEVKVAGTFERIVVSDGLPVAASLYQASKMIAAVAHLLQPGGTIWLAAECREGIGGSFEVVNEAIFELGIKPRLPPEHAIRLISCLSERDVERSYCIRGEASELSESSALVVPRSAASLLLTK